MHNELRSGVCMRGALSTYLTGAEKRTGILWQCRCGGHHCLDGEWQFRGSPLWVGRLKKGTVYGDVTGLTTGYCVWGNRDSWKSQWWCEVQDGLSEAPFHTGRQVNGRLWKKTRLNDSTDTTLLSVRTAIKPFMLPSLWLPVEEGRGCQVPS